MTPTPKFAMDEPPDLNIWVPYTQIQPATKIALRVYMQNLKTVRVGGDNFTYIDYFRERWLEGRTFINVEHDVVPWPGALEAIHECPEPWCAYGYHRDDEFENQERTLFPYLGCIKVSDVLIAATPGLWDADVEWLTMDSHFAAEARKKGFQVHQHWPSVINANPELLKLFHRA